MDCGGTKPLNVTLGLDVCPGAFVARLHGRLLG